MSQRRKTFSSPRTGFVLTSNTAYIVVIFVKVAHLKKTIGPPLFSNGAEIRNEIIDEYIWKIDSL